MRHFLSSKSYLWVLSWSLTTSEEDQSSSCPLKPPRLTPQTVGRRCEPFDTLCLLFLFRNSSPGRLEPSDFLFLLWLPCISKTMGYFGGSSWRHSTEYSWISRAPCHSNRSVSPKAAVEQLLLSLPEKINTFMRDLFNPLGKITIAIRLWLVIDRGT